MSDVISVVARRRRWTVEQKLALLEEVSRPGASIAAVADRHQMSRSLLFEWRRQVREGTMPGVMRAEADAPLVAVRVVDAAAQPEEERPPVQPTSSSLRSSKAAVVEVVLRNGRLMRVSETIRPEVLTRLVAALEA